MTEGRSHPEPLPSVALINHTSISLTRCACLGKTLLYQLLDVWASLVGVEQTLGGGARGWVILLSWRPVPWPSRERPGPLFPLDRSTPAPRPRPAQGGFWSSARSFCRIVAAGQGLWYSNTSGKHHVERTHCLTKTGWVSGCCRTCFGVQSSSLTLMCIYSWEESVCVFGEVRKT